MMGNIIQFILFMTNILFLLLCNANPNSYGFTQSKSFFNQDAYYDIKHRQLQPSICGNGYIDPTEACDDGNNIDQDGCSSNCKVESYWTCGLHANGVLSVCREVEGDGHWMGTSACDDYISPPVATTSASGFCTIAAGVSSVTAGKYCYPGVVGEQDVCIHSCGNPAGSNPYAVGSGKCDDLNNKPWDGCDPYCDVEPGYRCVGSPSVCTEVCGDGVRYQGGVCDDGNLFNYDGCNSNCATELGFFCNGASRDRPDVCEELCGDGRDYHNHPCDDGDTTDGDGCSHHCVVEQGYTCAGGMPGNPDNCWPTCGDGFVVGTEQCDIGNGPKSGISAPGCVNCVITSGWYCWNSSPYTASQCYEICGDGCAFGKYACDTGPAGIGRGCNSFCQIEVGFYKQSSGSGIPCVADVMAEICGDGHLFYLQCDDGNLINGDGCSSTCTIEPGWDCGYGNQYVESFCWPLFRPLIIDGSVSSDNNIFLVTLNTTVVTNPLTTISDFTINVYGPRENQWYPMSYTWTNQFQLQNKLGQSWFSFEPDYSDPLIQLFGDGAESFDITFTDQTKVYNSIYQDLPHDLINNYVFLGYINTPKESSYRCGMQWWWQFAWWSYIILVASNIAAAFLFRVPMYYSWGLTLSLQIVSLTPIMKSYLPSCLTYFLRDMMISNAWHPIIQRWFYNFYLFDPIYSKLDPYYNPLSYRLGRQGFIYNDVLVNIMESVLLWGFSFILEGAFIALRLLCFPLHYFGDHFADLERSFRYQVFIRGFQLCFLKFVFCSLLNINAFKYSGGVSFISSIVSIVLLIVCAMGMGAMLIYVFRLRKIPLYKMRRKMIFNMIYDDFKTKNVSRFSLLFFLFFFFKRIVYAIVLVFLSDSNLVPLDIFIFVVCIIPMLYFSYALPFKFIGINALLCINEFSETVVAVVLLHYQTYDVPDNEFFGYAQFLIKYVAIWIWINIAIFILHLIYAIIMLCCNLFKSSDVKYKEERVISSDSTSQESESSEERIATPEPEMPEPDEDTPEKEPTPPMTPEESEEEEDFEIKAAAVYVDDKNDNIHTVIHEVKEETGPGGDEKKE